MTYADIERIAQRLAFDAYHKPGCYFVLIDADYPTGQHVRAFPDTPEGYDDARGWMMASVKYFE